MVDLRSTRHDQAITVVNHAKSLMDAPNGDAALAGIVTIGPHLMSEPRDQVKPALCETKTVKRPEWSALINQSTRNSLRKARAS